MDLWTRSITTLVVLFSAPMPTSSGGLVVRASDSCQKTLVQSLARTQIFFFIHVNNKATLLIEIKNDDK